uniref:HAT C-terminal dimerisation domain-containing protein n=1 Tax=Myripristis murdjan TaxID=586833 RepID=A0A667YKI2_9TELE
MTFCDQCRWMSIFKKDNMHYNVNYWCFCLPPGCAVCSAMKSIGILTEKRVSTSEEWVSFKIQCSGTNDRQTALASYRNKIRRHETSRAHEIAQELTEKGRRDLLGNIVRTVSETVLAETDAIFRTAYYLAKMNRPFTDHCDLIELQQKNGVNISTSLHSRYSSTAIVQHIAKEMQKKIVGSIVSSSSKLSVLIDEATSLSHKSAMIVYVKASIVGATPEFLFLDLVELESQRAASIEEALLNCLNTAGFSEEWLQKNWVSFISDGASVMLGKNTGVATRLTARYPNLFTWHCMNHRLELAVADAVDEVQAVNHFKVFMEKIHNLYSQSNKNARELLEAAQEVGSQVLSIGRVLSTRWVASSFRSVKAVWRSYEALNRHFENRQTYRGLAHRLQSQEFLCDLELTLYYQKYSLTHSNDQNQFLRRTIRVLASFKDSPGEKSEEASQAQASGHFGSVSLHSNAKLTPINAKQFLQSLINNMEKRLSFEGEMLCDLSVLDTNTWPLRPGIRHGELQVKRLCRRFSLCEQQAVDGMRDFLEHPDKEPESLIPLIRCMQTIPCSTAECERGFSLMNNVYTDKRSTLLLSNVSNLMMISINGPPLSLFEPSQYVTTWLRSHRSATQAKRKCTQKSLEYKHIWKAL